MTSHVVVGVGPVGLHIAGQLAEAGEQVAVVSRGGTEVEGAVSVAGDLLATDQLVSDLKRGFGGADVVYFAAQPTYTRWPEEFPALQDAAIELAANLGAVLVAADNTYGYGPVSEPLHEQMPLAATGRKGSTRAAMSNTLFAAHRSGQVRAVAGRATNFFGPHVANSVLGDPFFGPLLAGATVPVLGSADTRHSWTYIADFAAALITLGRDERGWGRAWHVPCVAPVTIRDIATKVTESLSRSPAEIAVMSTDEVQAAGVHDPILGELAELMYEFEAPYIVDWTQYANTFGGVASDLDEALAATLTWYTNRRAA